MENVIATNKTYAVVGIGITGCSVVRYLLRNGRSVAAFDTRHAPAAEAQFRRDFPQVELTLGDMAETALQQFSCVIVSPGVPISHPAIKLAKKMGARIVGDIQIFVDEINQPVIAITGSNAKSTVTTLVGELLATTGKKIGVAGNIGKPVLDLLLEERKDIYVLELSSFQLETIENISAEVACILNVSEDHMDRYASMQEYYLAKQRVFIGAKKAVVNRDDALSQPLKHSELQIISFGSDIPDLNQLGLKRVGSNTVLMFGLKELINTNDLTMVGEHNALNVLAALAIGHLMGADMDEMLAVARSFKGLSHRCECVAEKNGVRFINDSKATNVGATLAALDGLKEFAQKIILIAGGEGKGADFSPLSKAFSGFVKYLVLIGADAKKIAEVATESNITFTETDSLESAVTIASQQAAPGDIVLLSPACASLDMFKNYQDRGEKFIQAVERIAA